MRRQQVWRIAFWTQTRTCEWMPTWPVVRPPGSTLWWLPPAIRRVVNFKREPFCWGRYSIDRSLAEWVFTRMGNGSTAELISFKYFQIVMFYPMMIIPPSVDCDPWHALVIRWHKAVDLGHRLPREVGGSHNSVAETGEFQGCKRFTKASFEVPSIVVGFFLLWLGHFLRETSEFWRHRLRIGAGFEVPPLIPTVWILIYCYINISWHVRMSSSSFLGRWSSFVGQFQAHYPADLGPFQCHGLLHVVLRPRIYESVLVDA